MQYQTQYCFFNATPIPLYTE